MFSSANKTKTQSHWMGRWSRERDSACPVDLAECRCREVSLLTPCLGALTSPLSGPTEEGRTLEEGH